MASHFPEQVVASTGDALHDIEEARVKSEPSIAMPETQCREGSSSQGDVACTSSSTLPAELSETNPSVTLPCKASSRYSRGRVCCRSFCAVAAALVALLMFFMWPRMPDWQVKKLIVQKDELNAIIATFTGPTLNSTTVTMDAVVAFLNNDFLGAEASGGNFRVTWEGHELARVTSNPAKVAARSYSEITAHATSLITPEAGRLLLAEVQKSNFKLQVALDGELPARVGTLFGLQVNVAVHCLVDLSVLMLLSNPDELATGHSCTYSVKF